MQFPSPGLRQARSKLESRPSVCETAADQISKTELLDQGETSVISA